VTTGSRPPVSNVISGLPKGSVERVTVWYDTPSPTLFSTDQHATRVILTLRGTSQDQKSTLYNEVRGHLDVVIGGFATSGIVIMKMIGIGMLVAVLLDATVVRALPVPATMRLLGRANG
jgi:hypothetical protein